MTAPLIWTPERVQVLKDGIHHGNTWKQICGWLCVCETSARLKARNEGFALPGKGNRVKWKGTR